jgi:phage baseplate assembly protein gpV
MTNSNPSVDPANLDNLLGANKEFFKKMMQGIDGMMPCQVIAFDRNDPNRVQVQHLITIANTDQLQISRGQISSLPVLQLGGGGFVLSFNLKTGDLGWVIAADRDISQMLQSYTTAAPQTYRVKNFADGVFIPDIMHGYTVAEEDAENMVLQSIDGTVKVSLGTAAITVQAPTVNIISDTTVSVTAPVVQVTAITSATITSPLLNVTGAINAEGGITAAGTITAAVSPFTITGDFYVLGNIAAEGSITPDVPP